MSDPRFNELFQLTSVISLLFQILATALIAVLSYSVSHAGRRRGMLYWSGGWACYMLSLVCVMFVSRAPGFGQALLFGYYFFEYAAVMLIFAGCRYTATEKRISPASRWLLVPAAIVALAFALSPAPFFWMFAWHTAIIGLGWIVCLAGLWPAMRGTASGPGVRIVAVGLVLLALDYLHHLPTGWYITANHMTLSAYYYTWDSLIDGMLEFILGFGTVVIIVDTERAELEAANVQLQAANERAAQALHTDPLTTVLSRYSFEESFRTGDRRSGHRGCVVVADLDELKEVNDRFGHAAGDAAIRAVADGLRSLIRQGDRIYRWGGDEFVVVM
ncbi:MAG: GGDEF domain-containing protein, partial [Candidatus Eremiobacterales bacterium]